MVIMMKITEMMITLCAQCHTEINPGDDFDSLITYSKGEYPYINQKSITVCVDCYVKHTGISKEKRQARIERQERLSKLILDQK